MSGRERALASLASRQHSVFTTEQAVGCGFSASAIYQRARRGVYVRRYRDVFVVAGAPPSDHAEIVAAVLSIGHVAAASHRTAAVLWKMTSRAGDAIEVVTNRWDRVHREEDFIVHESKDLISGDIAVTQGVPVTSPGRTIVDLCANAPRWLAAACFDTALRRSILRVEDVDSFVRRVARPGRAGVRRARELVAERRGWASITESELEDRFRQIIEQSHLPQPVAQFELRDASGSFVARVDFAYPDKKLLIELDSEAFHMDKETFQGDRSKQNRALQLGWRTLRFTWHDVTQDAEGVISTLAYLRAR